MGSISFLSIIIPYFIEYYRNGEKKHFKIDTYLCCDYSFTCSWLGLSPTANCFCYLCTVNRKSDEMLNFTLSSPLREPIDKWKIGQHGVQVELLLKKVHCLNFRMTLFQ
jgi:hypothetical protein